MLDRVLTSGTLYLQLPHLSVMCDLPYSSFSAELLTWAYFGHSYPFVVSVGFFQNLGSFLLIFRHTQLIGVITLMPVMLNILLINIIYGLPINVLIHSLTIMAGLLYRLFLHYDRLVVFFLRETGNQPRIVMQRRQAKNRIRLSVGVIPLLDCLV
jgi:hypothetical protein